jgi:transcriptional regulator with XRE-family HTH domain
MARKRHTHQQFKSVAEAMKALGLTDQKLADAVGCDRTWITRIRGGNKIISLTLPLRISRALNVPIEALADQDAA